MSTTKLTLSFEVDIDLSEVDEGDVELTIDRILDNLEDVARRGIDESMVTDDTCATIASYTIVANEVSESDNPRERPHV